VIAHAAGDHQLAAPDLQQVCRRVQAADEVQSLFCEWIGVDNYEGIEADLLGFAIDSADWKTIAAELIEDATAAAS